MEVEKVKVTIIRKEKEGAQIVDLLIEKFDNLEINLTRSNVDDIEKLFNMIFDRIVKEKRTIEFILDDSTVDLYHEVADDIVAQINKEIKHSEADFLSICSLNHE